VANDAGTYRTVGTSFEIGLLTDATPPSTRAALLDSIMKFFGCQVNPGVEEEAAHVNKPITDCLYRVYPNPSSKAMSISYNIAARTNAVIIIYDVAGRVVRELVKGKHDPGSYTLTWDGRDNRGKGVSAGVYFLSLATSDYQGIQKIIQVR